jgi:hypothetical protein
MLTPSTEEWNYKIRGAGQISLSLIKFIINIIIIYVSK